MNYSNLYQYKTVYHIYKASDRKLHIEGFPIVYMNEKLILFSRPGTKDVCRITKRYNDWKIQFDTEEKDKIKMQLGLDQIVEGYYLNVDVADAKQFCKRFNEQDDPDILRIKLKDKKERLERYEQNSEEHIKNLKFEIETLEEKLKDKEGALISDATSLE